MSKRIKISFAAEKPQRYTVRTLAPESYGVWDRHTKTLIGWRRQENLARLRAGLLNRTYARL